ncbi:phosphodiesterase, partial [Thermococcus sp. MV5]|nr:phosphodiesterase [Thermococcus sp. MV5]
PKDTDGRVLMEIFEENSEFAQRKPRYVDLSYYEIMKESEKLKKAIRDLKKKL